MGPNVKKLLEIASPPFMPEATNGALRQLDRLGEIGSAIKEILKAKNGFFCFESALRFFPSVTTKYSYGLTEWNSSELWKYEYRGLADDIFCFAEDIFCCQFCIANDGVYIFDPEIAELKRLAESIEGWAGSILKRYNSLTGYEFAAEWQKQHGPLPYRQRLMAKRQFALGGAYELSNMAAEDSVTIMRGLGNLASQIHDLPDGSRVRLVFGPRPN